MVAKNRGEQFARGFAYYLLKYGPLTVAAYAIIHALFDSSRSLYAVLYVVIFGSAIWQGFYESRTRKKLLKSISIAEAILVLGLWGLGMFFLMIEPGRISLTGELSRINLISFPFVILASALALVSLRRASKRHQ